ARRRRETRRHRARRDFADRRQGDRPRRRGRRRHRGSGHGGGAIRLCCLGRDRARRASRRARTRGRSPGSAARPADRAGARGGRRGVLRALLRGEGEKPLDGGGGEAREGFVFCCFSALAARRSLAPLPLPGPTGETNEPRYRGRGVFACISPWNFPLSIFLGQVSAALAAGNAVVAKPAEQTPLIAAEAGPALPQAGLPANALHLLPGDGKVGAALVADPCVAGVAFTGSTEVARAINRALAAKEAAIVPLIAETGGINPMIVDATALPEQVTDD